MKKKAKVKSQFPSYIKFKNNQGATKKRAVATV